MTDFKRALAPAVLIGSMVAGFGVAHADPDCIGLFVQRNKIYAEAHYCFKSPTALSYFSNEGCIPGEPRLTPDQQRRVAAIQREERADKCRAL